MNIKIKYGYNYQIKKVVALISLPEPNGKTPVPDDYRLAGLHGVGHNAEQAKENLIELAAHLLSVLPVIDEEEIEVEANHGVILSS